MSYCISSDCPNPKNASADQYCQACGEKLRLRDRYRVLGALGRGGFGATFLARDEALPGHPPCVVKQLRPTAEAPHLLEMARDLFQREAAILGKIGNHPQIPRLLDYFEISQEFFLIQEYISGSTLQQEVKRGGPFSEAGTKQFLSEVLPMLQYVHSHQVIHRDIKPANLIRRKQDKQLVLIDFGAVKDKVNPVQPSQTGQTALTAYAIGTPGYAPPEQMALRPVYASDLYSVGVTCVYLLTGKAPKDLAYDPQTGEMRWQEGLYISDHFAKVMAKLLESSVRHRYQSTDEVLRDLDLEPYLESLSQNLAFPAASVQVAEAPSADSLGEGHVSPTARLAAAIRAQRERSQHRMGVAPGRQRFPTGASDALSSDRSGASPTSRTAKLTAKDIQAAYAKGRRDFSNQSLSGMGLQRVVLAGSSFAKSVLKKANLQGIDLSNANLSKADLGHATLRSAKLGGAYLGSANLEGCDLRGADLTRACLDQANLRDANLCGADLTDAAISDEQLAVARTNWTTVYPNGKRGLR
ncbi:pentapeptide repeat-containing protein [Romeria aff. gracilis LEGE 07310]|uniref:Serine/threonine-protein kinase B n=1 Tax=Vasconcelosia minhoensis LEGE 07310 TaxID=915328 RepID=A0A8J7DRT9_9CYAN|nr:serine/threonine-protein kinase [Romeria gracilis]MBE9079309.1 pentapeptide repeat-containing protein [Romeria aff. gracilis LEGE 07310]